MFGAPSIVSVVDTAAMITAIFIVQWLLGAVGGLSIGQVKDGVKRLFCGRNSLPYRPRFPSISRRTTLISSKTSSLVSSPFRTSIRRVASVSNIIARSSSCNC